MTTAVLFSPLPIPGSTDPLIVGGLTILERQKRQVRRAGVTRTLIVADTPLDPVTVHGDVLVIDPGVVLDDRIVRMMTAAAAPSIATWPAALRGTERIDLHDLAAGIGLYPAALVRNTAATLGDWDLVPTLRRAALAAGAARFDLAALSLFDDDLGRDVPLVWAQPDDADSIARTDATLLAAAEPGPGGATRWLYRATEDAMVRMLLPLSLPADAIAGALVVGAGVAAVFFAEGWLKTGLALALAEGPLAGVVMKLGRVRQERRRFGGDPLEWAPFVWFAAAAHFAAIGSAGAWPTASLLIGFMLADRVQRTLFRRLTGRPLAAAGPVERRFDPFAARRDTLLWALLPFAAFGHWTTGFAVLAAYATASFFFGQWRTFVRLAERAER